MAFDPNAATARYIDSLGPQALQKAHDVLKALKARGVKLEHYDETG